MRIDDVAKFFGNGAKACEAIRISRSNFTKWKTFNSGIVPPQHAMAFHNASGGALPIRPEDYPLNEMQDHPTQQAA